MPFTFNSPPPRTLAVAGETLPTFGIDGWPVLVPVHLRGTEILGDLFTYTLTCRTSDELAFSPGVAANINLNEIAGREITVSIVIEGKGEFIPGMPGNSGMDHIGAGTREITALVSAARFVREESRGFVYEFTLRPWLWLATQNKDQRIFQNKNVVEITDAVLASYPYSVVKRLSGPRPRMPYPARDLQRQHDESDWTFLQRLWEEWGIHYYFEHEGGYCRLVLVDTNGAFQPHGEAYASIRYYPPGDRRIDEEHINRLSVTSSVTAGRVTLTDYDYTRARANLTVSREDLRDTGSADQEVYAWGDYAQPQQGASGLSGQPNDVFAEGDYLARVRMEALRCAGLRAQGSGYLRGLLAGHTFKLTSHPQDAANIEYLVVSSTLDIEEVAETSGSGQLMFRCDASFALQPVREPFRLRRTIAKPVMTGPEYAIVTGPDGQEIWTDAYGRVKVRWIWDRDNKPDGNSSCWLPVASSWQGNEFGTQHVPRIGQNVLVSHINGDPDRPVVTSLVVNQFNRTAWELTANSAISGQRTREVGGTGSSHLSFDDTKEQLQAQLATDHGKSSLSLGFIRRMSGRKGRQDARGKGFELRTDLWGVLRAAKGLFVTTDAREAAEGHAKAAAEMVARLTQARQQHDELSQLAQTHEAQVADVSQHDAVHAIKTQNDSIRGNEVSPENAFPELIRPDLVLASAAGIATTAADSTHLASGQDHAITAGRDVSISGGRSFVAAARAALSFFAGKLGIKIIAANGKVDVQAQNDEMALAALKDMTIKSTNGKIVLNASQEIWIGVGGSYIRITDSGIENGTTGQILEKCAKWGKQGAASQRAPLPDMPTGEMTSEWVTFVDHATGRPLANYPYRLDAGDGRVIEGISKANGRTAEVLAPTSRDVRVTTPSTQHELDTYHVPSRDVLDNAV